MSDELEQVHVIGVAGTTQIESRDPIEVVVERRNRGRPGLAMEEELGDVLERYPGQVGTHQRREGPLTRRLGHQTKNLHVSIEDIHG